MDDPGDTVVYITPGGEEVRLMLCELTWMADVVAEVLRVMGGKVVEVRACKPEGSR